MSTAVKERQLEPMSFRVQAEFIVRLAREGYWLEHRRVWAKHLLGEVQGLTQEQIMQIINGDIQLKGWSPPGCHIVSKPNKTWQRRVHEQKEWMKDRYIEVIPDRPLRVDSIAALLVIKHKLLYMLSEGTKGQRMQDPEQLEEEVKQTIEQDNMQEAELVDSVKKAFEEAGFYHVEDEDIKQFLDAMRHRYDVKDAARLRSDIDKKMEALAHEAYLDTDGTEEEKALFVKALAKKANIIHKYYRVPTWIAVPEALQAIMQGLDETSTDFRPSFGAAMMSTLEKKYSQDD